MCMMALSIVGTVFGVIGQIQQANAQANMANYQAKVAHNNAIIANRMAKDSLARGSEAEARSRIRTAALIGKQRATFGARNVAMDSGSPLDILGDTAMLGELDALTVRNEYQRESISHLTQQHNYSAQANLHAMEARNYRSAGMLNAFSTALSGASSFASNWG